jgi:hypothetical protein
MSQAKFMGELIFSSGPHRFSLGPSGTLAVPRVAIGQLLPGSILVGAIDFVVVVRGRIVANTEGDLDQALAAIIEKAEYPPASGLLTDAQGREYPQMRLMRVTTGDRVDRGGRVSLSYELRFEKEP